MRMLQRTLSLLLSLALLLTALPGSALAAEAGEPEILYTWSCGGGNEMPNANVTAVLDSGGTLTFKGNGAMYDFKANNLSMPWANAWSNISKVVVQEGVTSVCPRAFYINFTGIASVEIAGSVRTIGDEAFLCKAGNSSCLTQVVIRPGPSGREIGYRAFAAQSSLTNVVLGKGISVIGEDAFTGCFELSDISLPDTLTRIDRFAFVNCNALSELHLPESLESVGDGVFQNCKALREVILPSHVTSLGEDVFYNSAVTRVAVPEGLTVPDGTIPSGVEVKTYTGETPKDFDSIVSGGVELQTWNCGGSNTSPDARVTAVLDSAGTLTIRGSGPMCDYKNVYLQDAPWASHEGIKRVLVADGVTRIGNLAFQALPNLESAEIAGSVQTIGENAFNLCPKLARVTVLLGGGCEIGRWAFRDCKALREVTLGEGVSTVGYMAFSGCSLLETVGLPNTLTKIEDSAFSGTGLRTLKLPENLTTIEQLAFTNCDKLETVRFPDSLTTIGNSAFSGCTKLEEAILPKNLASLGTTVFFGSGVKRVAVPQGLEVPYQSLPDGAEVKTYTGETPKDFDSIPGGSGDPSGDILQTGTCDTGLTWTLYKTGLLQIQGSGAMKDYSSYSDYPFASHAAEVTSLAIADGVTRIGSGAFRNFTNLKTVRMADSVTEIGNTAFLGCSSLTQAELSSKIRRIETSTFKDCSALTEIEIPEGITYFGDWAFWNTGLTHVKIARAASYQEGSLPSFPAGCTVERYGGSVVVPPEDGKVVQSGPCAKSGSSPSYQLYDNGRLVISGTGEMADYATQNSSPWRQWSGVYPYPTVLVESGVKSVGAYSFYALNENQYVKTVQLPGSVSKIGNSAFAGNRGLEQITMSGVTEIGQSAFATCAALTGLQIPEGLASIGNYAFSGSGLQGELTFPESLTSIGKEAFADTELTHVRVYYRTEVPADAFPAGCRLERYGAPTLTPGAPLPVSSRTAPVGSDNIHDNAYSAWSQVVCSYLASGSEGGFRRVDCYSQRDPDSGEYVGTLVMEEYDRDGAFLRSWDIPWELPYFGGFYEGSDGYYFVFANSNSQQSSAVETVRVVKYTKDLEPLGKASLMGGNVATPFYMGSLRMDEGGGTLYVYMGRQMYDGHQSSLVLAVDTSTMQIRYEGTDMFHPFYVSHSMNQFIKYDPATGQVAAASQGDTYPRALTLMRSSGTLGGELGETRFLIPGGNAGNNHTLTTLGGLEVAGNNYLTAWTSIDQSVFDIVRTYNISLSVISKTDEKTYRNVAVTSYQEGGPVSAGNPFLVKVGENRFALLWEEQKRKETVSASSPAYSIGNTTGQVCFAYYDGEGSKLSGVHRMDGALSDCQPIVVGGSILWYVTEEGKAPVFYRITGESGGVLKSYAGTVPGGGDEDPPDLVLSGSCGKTGSSVTWSLYTDGTLVIEGSGEIKDCTRSSGVTGESTAKTACKRVVIKEGVTGIGDYAFYGYGNLESVELPDSLGSIGNYAFNGCTSLAEVTLPKNVSKLGTQPFGSSGLTRARVYYTLKYSAGAFPASCVVTLYGKTLTPSAPLEATRTAPVKTGNIHSQNYNGKYNRPSWSHLCAGLDGGFYRVEYAQDCGLVMEEYDRSGAFLQGWDIPMELPLFGGFYSGSGGFYFVFGQNNPSDSDSVEVLRVVKYTRGLERLGAASLMGGNTYIPFDASGCRMDEGNGLLYIHTGHEMYQSSDGYHHQACMTFSVDTEAMEFQYQFYGVANPEANGYVSHSFNQFVRVDGNQVIRLDHGDGAPRGVGLFVNGPSLAGRPSYALPFTFYGGFGENVTGASVGGLEVSPSAYLSAISSVDQNSGKRNNNKTFNVYLLVTDKESMKTTQVQLTSYSEGGAYSCSTPQLVKLSDDRFLLLWEEQARRDYSGGYYYSDYAGQVKYAIFDGAGNRQGGIRSMAGALSDCQPAVTGGKATWYTTERTYSAADKGYVMSAPTFYQIDSAGSGSSFQATIGKKPEGVALPEELLAKLGSCETVLAASHSAQGRMTGVIQGALRGKMAVFSRRLSRGWTLYFLDGNGAPVCPAYPLP